MGNRAVITTPDNFKNNGVGIYLHWNGGRDSVEAFLKYCKLRGFRAPEDDCYGWARLCQVIANFMGGDGTSTSIGIDSVKSLDCDNYDNGVYLIENWEIVGREFFKGEEQNEYDLMEFLRSLDNTQPSGQRLGERMIQDLIDNDKTIGEIDGMYFYHMESMAGKKQQAAPFRFGSRYKRYQNDTQDIITILDMVDGKLRFRYRDDDEVQTSPIFHWRNGLESIRVKIRGQEFSYNSNEEVI